MDRKKVILLVAALFIAAITAFMARSMFTGAAAPTSGSSQAGRNRTQGHGRDQGTAGRYDHYSR